MRVAFWTLVVAASLGACGGVDVPTRHSLGLDGECTKYGDCPTVDAEPGPSDRVVELASGALVTLASGKQTSVEVLDGGEVAFKEHVPYCVPTTGAPCSITLQRLVTRFGNFDLSLSDGSTIGVSQPIVSLVAPLEIRDQGSGYVIPEGSVFQTCALVNGRRHSGTLSIQETSVLVIDPVNQNLSVDLASPMVLHADNSDCSELPLTLYVVASGVTPWTQ